jgi:hypothetical protein
MTITHDDCVQAGMHHTDVHTHEGQVGFWFFPSEGGQRCTWKARWTFGTDVRCSKAAHVSNRSITLLPSGQFSTEYEGDGQHRALLDNGVTWMTWEAGDRREFEGAWPGPCKLADCTLHDGHHGKCAP